MINIKKLKLNKDVYVKAFLDKGADLSNEVNQVIELHDKWLVVLEKENKARMESNSISSQISKDPSRKDELLAEAVIHSDQADKFTTEAKDLLKEITDISSTFPNVASASTPIGKDEADNTVISEHHIELQTQGKPHYEIMEELELGMQEESGILAGSRHVIYSGKGAELVRAIELYLLDMNMKNGFKLITPPVLVNSEMLYNTGQLPKFKDDLYELKNGQYLIPTAEVPLTNLVTGKMLKEEELPIRYTSLTNCFRLEAGSAGMDTRGIIRLHQFRKVELVSIINPKDHETELNFLLKTATSILDNLKISYRIVELCTGDLGFSAEKTFDIEVWLPGQNKYREISSVSCMSNFQARRMNTRFKTNGEKELVYTLNGSSLAVERTFAAIIENYYDNGKIMIPDVLQKYLDFKEI